MNAELITFVIHRLFECKSHHEVRTQLTVAFNMTENVVVGIWEIFEYININLVSINLSLLAFL